MRVTLVHDIQGFAALKMKWRALLDRCEDRHAFMTWEWLFTWWSHFREGRQLFVLTVEDRGEVIGIVPLMLFVRDHKRAQKIRYLHFIGFRFGGGLNDWMDVIGIRKEEVVRAALDYLRKHQHAWDFFDLWDVPGDSDTIRILTEAANEFGFQMTKERIGTCPYMPTVSGWESYYEQRRSLQTGGVDRQIRRLQARGDLTVHWADASNMFSNLEALFDLHQRSLAVRQQPSRFSEHAHRSFYRTVVQVFPRDLLDCSLLRLNGRAIAAHFGFRYNAKFYYVTPAFDPDYAVFSPGKVLLRYMVERCFADDGTLEFDFLRGQEAYKYEWATGERHAYRLLARNAYMSGWIGKISRRAPPYVRRSLIELARVFPARQRGGQEE